jgi:hypothetical protein
VTGPWRPPGAVAAAVLALAATLPSTEAHRAPGSLSTIDYNTRSGNTEVVHRLHSHDAELGIGTMLDMPDLSVLTIEGRAWIALYVEEHFLIESEQGPIPLSMVGAELAADYVLVYQETSGPLPDVIRIRDDILRDVFPEQINQVNIDTGESVRSLVFSNDDEWRRFEFGRSGP